jgi:hypothetical protein
MKSILVVFGILFLLSCSTFEPNYSGMNANLLALESKNRSDFAFQENDKKPYDEHDAPVESNSERKIVYTYNIDLESKNIEEANSIIEELAKINNGYVSSSSNSYIEIKVPSEKAEFVVNQLSKAGKILDTRKYSNDVTLEYYDTKLRLENMYKSRERYLELLEQAENVETALKVERELERLLYDIESVKARLSNLEKMVAFTTITINIKEKVSPGPIGWVFYGLYHSVKWLIVWD